MSVLLNAYNTSKHASSKYSPLPNEQCIGNTANTFGKYVELSKYQVEVCALKMQKIQILISEKVIDNVQDAQHRQKSILTKDKMFLKMNFRKMIQF